MMVPMPDREADEEAIRLEDSARLEGVRLAARTLEHHLTNHLTLTVGYAELIAEDPELPERLRDMARQVLDNAQGCVEVIRRLRQVRSVRLSAEPMPGGPLLEFDPPLRD
jgi:hypothetical protein